METNVGTYALIFSSDGSPEVSVGSLGQLQLAPGYFIYVGSAFGPGGVKARIEHHRRISSSPHWHLDYLRPFMTLIEIWFTYDTVRREHQWADDLFLLRGLRKPFPGFGASDCRCGTHFFGFGYKPSFASFRRRMRRHFDAHKRIYLELPAWVEHETVA